MTCATVLISVMLLHAFLTLGISLIFFEYQAGPFTNKDFWYFVESLLFEILVLLWVSALLSWLCSAMKNVGLVIVMYIAIDLLLVIAGSIVQVILPLAEYAGADGAWIDVLEVLDRINIGNAATYIGQGTSYTTKDVLYLTIPAITGILGFLGLGLQRFNKKDLK